MGGLVAAGQHCVTERRLLPIGRAHAYTLPPAQRCRCLSSIAALVEPRYVASPAEGAAECNCSRLPAYVSPREVATAAPISKKQ